jgi:hypothetical protein
MWVAALYVIANLYENTNRIHNALNLCMYKHQLVIHLRLFCIRGVEAGILVTAF